MNSNERRKTSKHQNYPTELHNPTTLQKLSIIPPSVTTRKQIRLDAWQARQGSKGVTESIIHI
jgi:hypothetical protein